MSRTCLACGHTSHFRGPCRSCLGHAQPGNLIQKGKRYEAKRKSHVLRVSAGLLEKATKRALQGGKA